MLVETNKFDRISPCSVFPLKFYNFREWSQRIHIKLVFSYLLQTKKCYSIFFGRRLQDWWLRTTCLATSRIQRIAISWSASHGTPQMCLAMVNLATIGLTLSLLCSAVNYRWKKIEMKQPRDDQQQLIFTARKYVLFRAPVLEA